MHTEVPMCSYMNNENIQADAQWGCTYRDTALVHTLYKHTYMYLQKMRGGEGEEERKNEKERGGKSM